MYRPFSPNATPPGAALVGALVDLILLNYEVDPQSADYQQSHASVGVRIRHAEKLDKAILQHFGAALAQLKSRSPYGDGIGEKTRSGDPAAGARPGVQIVVAYEDYGVPEEARLIGSVVFEYVPGSDYGLIKEMHFAGDERVETDHSRSVREQRMDIAQRLKEAAAAAMEALAPDELSALFAEVIDFRGLSGADRDEAALVMQTTAALGAKWLDLPFPPAPAGTPGRLLLVYPPNPLNPFSIETEVVKEFLEDYAARWGLTPADPPLVAMQTRLTEGTDEYAAAYGADGLFPYRELPELIKPVLRIDRAAICLHLITVEVTEKDVGGVDQEETAEAEAAVGSNPAREEGALRKAMAAVRGATRQMLQERYKAPGLLEEAGITVLHDPKEYVCPVFHSFEIDILSYRFQDRPPIASVCGWEEQQYISIEFPKEIVYVAEGKQYTKCFQNAVLDARVALTYSRFPETGIRIWHLTLMPCDGAVFSEFDFIRLIGLYYSEQERTRLLEQTRFRRKDKGEDREEASWLSFEAFLYALSEEQILAGRPVGGTIEWIPSESGDSVPWNAVLSALYGAANDDQEAFRTLEDLYGRYEEALDACCGVVTGHFDYAQMSFAEMQDTLTPSSSAGSYAVWMHRSVLTNIDLQDEMLDRLRSSIGISPYLILPHAVMLHNEFVIDQADEIAENALDARTSRKRTFKGLIEDRRMIEHVLRRYYVPNVFHYELERELYEIGSQNRGSLEKKQGVELKLESLNSLIRDKSDRAITIFLGLFGLGSVLSIVDFFLQGDGQKVLFGLGSLIGTVVLYVIFSINYSQGIER
jgi:hypothetical protein